jgi:hypothetical protein
MPDARISIELYDDVAWDAAGTAMERLQLKHHLNTAASITDKGADLWRTIGVWMDEASPGDPNGELLALVTTAAAPADSGVYRLRPPTRDASEAQRLIEKAAQESAAQDSAENRARFLGLSETDRQTFISRMHVLDGQPHAVDIDESVRKQLMWAMPRGRDDLFMEMLWGWWSGEVLAALSGRRGSIGVGEVQDRIAEIRDQFAEDRLPTLLNLSDIGRDEARHGARDDSDAILSEVAGEPVADFIFGRAALLELQPADSNNTTGKANKSFFIAKLLVA